MVLRSPWTVLVCTATALVLAGCSAPETDGDDSPPTSSAPSAEGSATGAGTDAPEEAETSSGPEVQATSGAVVDGFPSVIAELPDSEVVLSSVQPAADGQPVDANLTMRTTSSEDDVLDFYSEHFEDADFSPVGDPDSNDGVTSQRYHSDEGPQTVAVSISPDPDGGDGLLVSVGGTVLP